MRAAFSCRPCRRHKRATSDRMLGRPVYNLGSLTMPGAETLSLFLTAMLLSGCAGIANPRPPGAQRRGGHPRLPCRGTVVRRARRPYARAGERTCRRELNAGSEGANGARNRQASVGRRARAIWLMRRSGSCSMACAARTASPSCAAVKASPKGSITVGRKSFSRPGRSSFGQYGA